MHSHSSLLGVHSEHFRKERPNRRQTWGGGKIYHLPRFSLLGSIPEVPQLDTSLVMVSNDVSFSTPYEDFEVQLVENEREKSEDMCSDFLNLSRLDCSGLSNRRSSHRDSRCSTNSSPGNVPLQGEVGDQTPPNIHLTPTKTPKDKTPTAVLYARIAALEKDWDELETFTSNEKDIIRELENELRQKEEQCLNLQSSLSNKEKILNETLLLQESLTHKLMEYDAALEKNRKDHVDETNKRSLLRLEEENDKLKRLVLDLRRRLNNQEKSLDQPSTSKQLKTTTVSSPRRRAALDRLVRDAAQTSEERKQTWPCAWKKTE